MKQEEKAKAYDEALERARVWKEKSGMPANKQGILDDIFPELTGSEDERIRNQIINFIEEYGNPIHCEWQKDWIAWLEKQGEQKPILNVPTREVILSIWDLGNEWKELTNGCISTEYGTQLDYIQKHWRESEYYLREKQGEQRLADKVEPKFNVGDWILYSGDHYEGVRHITKIDENGYYIERNGLPHGIIPFNHEICMRLWTIQDAKDGDVLCDYHETYDNPLIFILKKFEHVNFGLVRPSDYSSYCFLTAGDIQRFKEGTYHHKHNIKPATKEQCDILFTKMKEAGYEWNAEKKELKLLITNGGDFFETENCEQKPAWNEEDEKFLKQAIEEINYALNDKDLFYNGTLPIVDWLKSLKERYAWKPSDEQIKVCKEVYADLLSAKGFNLGTINSELNRLEEQLKKLKD